MLAVDVKVVVKDVEVKEEKVPECTRMAVIMVVVKPEEVVRCGVPKAGAGGGVVPALRTSLAGTYVLGKQK